MFLNRVPTMDNSKTCCQSGIQLNVTGSELADGIYRILYDGKSNTIYGTINGLENINVVVEVNSVIDIGEYRVKAKISSDNYCGEKEFTVQVYTNAGESGSPDDNETPNDDTQSGVNLVGLALGVGFGFVGVCIIAGVIFAIVYLKRKK